MSFFHLADRMNDIKPFYVMDLLARAKKLEASGRSIIHLEVGEPDFSTPETIIKAGHSSLDTCQMHYTPAVGLTELREKIAGYYQSHFNVQVPVERIIVTPGASGALQLALSVLINPADEVLMTDPGYPCNRHFVRLLEGQSVNIPVTSATNYQLTADLIARHWSAKTAAALVATPSNPTGTIINQSDMSAIIEAVNKQQGYLVVDEIYQGLTYETENFTVLSLTDQAFVINSFSKFFGMTGWRLGWMVVPDEFVEAVDKLAQNIFLAPPTLSQYAAIEAFNAPSLNILEHRRQEFKRRRDYLLPALKSLGFEISVDPQGAFYIYANCHRFTDDSFGFVNRLLEEAGVAITPGIDFGEFNAHQHVRFAYTRPVSVLEDAVARLNDFLKHF
ncbi:MAG: pyridoxal phosphate-dependent aminotransferase [Gammaproteobacteria bacterium]|nr:pyridoxal phosphate-dependent aminotransferase [Gammaproteobacteria bacterium]